jgi:hypothetical protein
MASIKDFIKNLVVIGKNNNTSEELIKIITNSSNDSTNITVEKAPEEPSIKNSEKPEDSSPNFIKKSEDNSKENKNEAKDIKSKLNKDDSKKLDDIIDIFRNTKIRPLANQNRNLGVEEGGIEHENKENEIHTVDNWDNRGEEIIKMTESQTINKSSAKKSMLWNLKQKKMQEKKINEELADLAGDLKKIKMQNSQDGNEFDSRKQQSLTQRIQALKEDRTDFKPPSNIR